MNNKHTEILVHRNHEEFTFSVIKWERRCKVNIVNLTAKRNLPNECKQYLTGVNC